MKTMEALTPEQKAADEMCHQAIMLVAEIFGIKKATGKHAKRHDQLISAISKFQAEQKIRDGR